MPDDLGRKVLTWERHGQSIMLAIITSVLAYSANAMVDAKTSQASMAAELRAMAAQMQRLEGAFSAMQNNYVSRAEFNVHEQRLQAVEARKP
jgi:hypothetical protein